MHRYENSTVDETLAVAGQADPVALYMLRKMCGEDIIAFESRTPSDASCRQAFFSHYYRRQPHGDYSLLLWHFDKTAPGTRDVSARTSRASHDDMIAIYIKAFARLPLLRSTTAGALRAHCTLAS